MAKRTPSQSIQLTPEQVDALQKLIPVLAGGAQTPPADDEEWKPRRTLPHDRKRTDTLEFTVVRRTQLAPNRVRLHLVDEHDSRYIWDASSGFGLARQPGDKFQAKATIFKRENGIAHLTRLIKEP